MIKLKTLYVLIISNMTYPQEFLDADEETRIKIVELGTYIYFHGKSSLVDKNTRETEDLYSENLKNLKLECQHQLLDIQKHYESIYNNNETKIQANAEQTLSLVVSEKNNQINFLKNCLEQEQLKNVEATHELHNNYKIQLDLLSQRNQELEKENTKALDISEKLDNLIGKKSSIDNTTKGDFGETIVNNQILYSFPKSIITDTSGQTAKGDLLWCLDNNQFKALVEVKNVQYVRVSDVQKFERDIQVNVKENTCNCALFVSLKTEIIQSKGGFQFEFFNGIPILYVANVFCDPQILKLALNILYNIQTSIGSHIDASELNEAEQTNIEHYLSTLYNSLTERQKFISSSKTTAENLLQNIITQQSFINSDIDTLIKFSNTLKWCNLEIKSSNSLDISELLCIKMRDFFRDNERWPTCNELVGSDSRIKKSHVRGQNSIHNLRIKLENSI